MSREVVGMTATLGSRADRSRGCRLSRREVQSGAIGTLQATTSAWPGLLKKTEIHGTQGSAIIVQTMC